MKVLFLILNFKTYNETIRLTDSLLNCNMDDKYILIVDNNSPNDSYTVLCDKYQKRDNVTVILSPENGGYAKGNNFGLRYAEELHPEFVCIINNDVYFSMQTIDNLCLWYEKLPSPAFIAPKQMLPNEKEAIFSSLDVPTIWDDLASYNPFSRKNHLYVENTAICGVNKVGLIPGAFIFTKYNTFKELGFFDEITFLFCEERLIAKKAQIKGLSSYIILGETYLHKHSTTIKNEASESKQRKMIFNGRCLYHKKYSSNPDFCVLILKAAFYFNEFIRFKFIRPLKRTFHHKNCT